MSKVGCVGTKQQCICGDCYGYCIARIFAEARAHDSFFELTAELIESAFKYNGKCVCNSILGTDDAEVLENWEENHADCAGES